jgi:hypothetical protein
MWPLRFGERYPKYFKRRQKTINIHRKRAHDPEDIEDWYERYRQICKLYDIEPAHIWNVDGTGFMIGIGRDQWVLTRDATRPSYLDSSTNRKLVTVIEAVSGGERVILPMDILPGKIHQEHWYMKTGLNDDSLVGVSESGYTNDHLALKWVAHFKMFTRPSRKGTYRLLVRDGHDSHESDLFLGYLEGHRIIPLFLNKHTTHLVHLDVILFQPYKHYHAEAINKAARLGCANFKKTEFHASLSSIRKKNLHQVVSIVFFPKDWSCSI